MTETLRTIFPDPKDLLTLGPEELGGTLLEIIPGIMQSSGFTVNALLYPLYATAGAEANPTSRHSVHIAIAEAIAWLISSGLLIETPGQGGRWYLPTRRATALKTRVDVELFRKGRILPVELLQPVLAEKVWPLFLRGDHDVAVFQAFKEVEVAVRGAANAKAANYPDDLVGVPLIRKAFHPESGQLTNKTAAFAEREAEMHLFGGAIGHAKNPTSHRDVNLPPQAAARLVVFASYLLSIVEERR